MARRSNDGQEILGALKVTKNVQVGSGDKITNIKLGTVSVDPAAINTLTRGEVDVTLTGAKVGDFVNLNPPVDLEATLLFVGARVKAADTITVFLYNQSGGTVNGAAKNWTYLLVSKS